MVKMRRKPGADAVMFARPTLISASIFIKPPAENADCEGEETSRYGFDSKLLQRSFKTILFTQIPMTAMSIISSMLHAKWWRIEGHRQDWHLSCPSTFLEGRLSTIYLFICKSMDRLCKIWDVSQSATVSITTVSEDSAGDLHRYDDRYFLDPETLRKERETSENLFKRI